MSTNFPGLSVRVGALMIVAGSLTATVARAQLPGEDGAEAKRIGDAATVLANVAAPAANPIPRAVLEKAEAILVFPYSPQGARVRGQGPNQIRNAAEEGIRGRGILSVRTDAGSWSAPSFVTLNGGGRHNGDLVLVIPSRKGVDAVVSAIVGKFALDAGGASAVGPLGAAAAPDVTALIYSQPRDWAGKTTFKGVYLTHDARSNESFYGKPVTSREAIARTDGPEPVAAWRAALSKHVR